MRRSGVGRNEVTVPRGGSIVMSRDMLIGCPESFLFFELVSLGHSAFSVSGSGAGFCSAGLTVFIGVVCVVRV